MMDVRSSTAVGFNWHVVGWGRYVLGRRGGGRRWEGWEERWGEGRGGGVCGLITSLVWFRYSNVFVFGWWRFECKAWCAMSAINRWTHATAINTKWQQRKQLLWSFITSTLLWYVYVLCVNVLINQAAYKYSMWRPTKQLHFVCVSWQTDIFIYAGELPRNFRNYLSDNRRLGKSYKNMSYVVNIL